uniref:Carboxylesterase type B domain-containing protein n=2 Tax=Ciona intestinalis TaxID=7719 RepID=H2XX17_CIOIN
MHYNKVLEQYPECTEPGCDNRENLNHLATEYLFTCPQRKALNSTALDRWWYILNQTWSFYEVWEQPQCFYRVCHAAELAYLFNVEPLTTFEYTEEEKVLSERFAWYWTNFAKRAHPNGKTSKYELTSENVQETQWPQFNNNGGANYQALQIRAAGDFVMDRPYEEICRFWDELDAYAEHY